MPGPFNKGWVYADETAGRDLVLDAQGQMVSRVKAYRITPKGVVVLRYRMRMPTLEIILGGTVETPSD